MQIPTNISRNCLKEFRVPGIREKLFGPKLVVYCYAIYHIKIQQKKKKKKEKSNKKNFRRTKLSSCATPLTQGWLCQGGAKYCMSIPV